MDPGPVRTSQRPELLAAIHGIRKLAEYEDFLSEFRDAEEVHNDSSGKITWVIAYDSEYVVSGMTEWVPAWNASNTRCSCLSLWSPFTLTEQRVAQLVEKEAQESRSLPESRFHCGTS